MLCIHALLILMVAAAGILPADAGHLNRSKRGISFNGDESVAIDAAITIPISVAFPSLTRRSGRSGRWRSGAAAAAAVNATTPAGSYDDPVFVHQLRNIDLFMDYFQVEMDVCRQRFLCELASCPDRYEPLYHVFKKQLTGGDVAKSSDASRYHRYWSAFRAGSASALSAGGGSKKAACGTLYAACPNGVDDVIDTNFLGLLHFFMRTLHVRIGDP